MNSPFCGEWWKRVAEQVFLIDLGIVVLVALLLGIVFNRLKQNSALGYILAGVVLGPLGFKYLVPGEGLAPVFGELGVIMILFYLGLELNMRKLRETGGISLVLAFAQMTTAFVLGFAAARLFGFGEIESLVIGAMIVATSTVIVARFIIEKGIIDKLESRIALGILLLQDFFAIFMLVFFTSLGTQRSLNTIVLNALIFMIGMFYVVSKGSRHILNFLHSLGHGDKMVFYAIGVGVVSAFAGTLLGLSSALGAYFAGFALAESPYGDKIKRELGFVREFFVLFFFVSFGSNIFYDFELGKALVPTISQLLPLVLVALVLVAAYVIGSATAFYLTGTLMGLDRYVAGNIAVLLIPLGEFVIIIASASRPLVEKGAFDSLVALAFLLIIFTSPVSSFLYPNSRRITDFFFSLLPRPAQAVLSRAHERIENIEKAVSSPLLQDRYVIASEQLVKHLVIAFSIVYLSVAINERVPNLGSEFLPREISAGFVVLLLVTWPLYRLVVELRFLVEVVSRQLIHSAFPAVKKSELYIEDEVADVFTGIFLTVAGLGATILVYTLSPQQPIFVIAPAAYTLLALMQLSRSFYSLVEHYDTLGSLEGMTELPRGDRTFTMGREFEASSRKFHLIHAERERVTELVREALRNKDSSRVRALLSHLKRREARILSTRIAPAPPHNKKHPGQKKHVEHYLLKQASKKAG